MTVGPDAARYWFAASGLPVPRPFHVRRVVPRLLGPNPRRWWIMWAVSWPTLTAGMVWWRLTAGDPIGLALVAAALLVALPGILGPAVSIPVQLDLPATAVTVVGVALFEQHRPVGTVAAVVVFAVAASMRETSPIWAALWAWTPIPLVALVVPAVIAWCSTPAPVDPLGDKFTDIAKHPVRSAFTAHRGQWRDAGIMLVPWGACLAALYGPSWHTVAVVAAAHLVLFAATDTVRLVHHAAGPWVAVAAAHTIPARWAPVAVIAGSVTWWRTPVRT